jgi:TorA maturation chaperone TorD
MEHSTSIAVLEALSNFFAAQNSDALRRAYGRLAAVAPLSAPPVPDWQVVEFAFNRLFVGPGPLQAAPFASVYLDPEPQLMGQTTLKIRQLYQLVGLSSPWKNIIPDDHLSFELDAYRQVKIARASVDSAALAALQTYFLQQHLQPWLVQFAQKVKAAGAVPAAIIFVVDQLAGWLAQENEIMDKH